MTVPVPQAVNPVEILKTVPARTPKLTEPLPDSTPTVPAMPELTSPPEPQLVEWYYYISAQKLGPVPPETIVAMIRTGALNSATQIWREGLTEWVPLGTTPDFAACCTVTAQTPPANNAGHPAGPEHAGPNPSRKSRGNPLLKLMLSAIIIPSLIVIFVFWDPSILSDFLPRSQAERDADVHCTLGNAHNKGDRYEEAIAEYKKAISIKSDYAEAYYRMGHTYKRMRQYPEAIAAYKMYLDIEPTGFWADDARSSIRNLPGK
jgi:tetratricopeptide (TPR) repeat protein